MSVLSATTQKQIEATLVKHGLINPDKLNELYSTAEKTNSPLLSLVVSKGGISNEALTKTIAKVTKVPYVNLSSARIDPQVLTLLPEDVAQRYMAVPLGEMQHRLVVAMLDADNVQAVDFLANKIGRQLKVYAASEEGIRHVLTQYKGEITQEVQGAFSDQEEIESLVVDNKSSVKDIEAAVQDSPVSKVLTAMLEYAASHRAS